jgi:hypothetical protein
MNTNMYKIYLQVQVLVHVHFYIHVQLHIYVDEHENVHFATEANKIQGGEGPWSWDQNIDLSSQVNTFFLLF